MKLKEVTPHLLVTMDKRKLKSFGSIQDSGDLSTQPSLRPNPNPAPTQTLATSPETWIDPVIWKDVKKELGGSVAIWNVYVSAVARARDPLGKRGGVGRFCK